MSRIIEACPNQQWLFPPTLDEILPADHPARFVSDFVDEFFAQNNSFKKPSNTSAGGPAFSSQLLLRVWLYGWMHRTRTPRMLERMARNDIGMLWLTGLNAPDHNTLWRFWSNNKKAMKELFKHSVKVALNMGLVQMAFHAVDGTKVLPCSSKRSALHKDDIDELLARLDESIAEMEKEIAIDPDYAMLLELPEDLANAKTRRAEIRQQLEKLVESDKKHLLPAEPEALMIRSGKTEFNYNAQVVVDSSNQIIVGEHVCTDAFDDKMLVPMIKCAAMNLGGKSARHIVADGGYGSAEQLSEAAGYEITVPVGERGELHNALHSHHFQFDDKADELICPLREQRLPYCKTTKARKGHPEARIYRCPAKTCPLRTACFSNKRGREIEVRPTRPATIKQVSKHMDGSISKAMKKRMGVVEPVFARIKHLMGFRRFNVRKLDQVQHQWSLLCATSNLMRLFKAWKDRHPSNKKPNATLHPPATQQQGKKHAKNASGSALKTYLAAFANAMLRRLSLRPQIFRLSAQL